MKKIAIAFVWSELMAFLAGCFVGLAMIQFDYSFWVGPILTNGITTVHGWIQARQLFMTALGERKTPSMAVSGRHIPVSAGGMLTRFENAISSTRLDLEMENELTVITPTGIVITEDRVKDFVGKAWSNQLRGKTTMSRKYWTKTKIPPWDREEYDALIYCLVENGFIQGRMSGKSGKLTADYKTIVDTIKRSKRG